MIAGRRGDAALEGGVMGLIERTDHRGVLADLLAVQARLRREPASWHPAHLDAVWPASERREGPWPAPGEVPALQRRIGKLPAPGDLPALQRRILRRSGHA